MPRVISRVPPPAAPAIITIVLDDDEGEPPGDGDGLAEGAAAETMATFLTESESEPAGTPAAAATSERNAAKIALPGVPRVDMSVLVSEAIEDAGAAIATDADVPVEFAPLPWRRLRPPASRSSMLTTTTADGLTPSTPATLSASTAEKSGVDLAIDSGSPANARVAVRLASAGAALGLGNADADAAEDEPSDNAGVVDVCGEIVGAEATGEGVAAVGWGEQVGVSDVDGAAPREVEAVTVGLDEGVCDVEDVAPKLRDGVDVIEVLGLAPFESDGVGDCEIDEERDRDVVALGLAPVESEGVGDFDGVTVLEGVGEGVGGIIDGEGVGEAEGHELFVMQAPKANLPAAKASAEHTVGMKLGWVIALEGPAQAVWSKLTRVTDEPAQESMMKLEVPFGMQTPLG